VTGPDRERRALWAAALIACLGVFAAIWSVPLVMTNDGPEAVLTAHMEAHYDDPGSIYEQQFAVGFGLSGRGFSVVYRAVAAVFSFPNALRVTQLIMVLAFALAVAWLSRALAPEGRRRARFASLLGFAIAFSWPFYMGFWAFTISMTVGLMVVAFVVQRSRGLTLIEKAAVSTVLLVQVFLHGFAVFITLGLVGLVVLTRALMQRGTAPPSAWRKATLGDLAWLGLSALPSVVVLLIMRTAQKEMATLPGSGQTEWASLSDWGRVLPRLAVPGSTPLGILVFALAAFAMVRTALRLRRAGAARRPEAVAVLVGGAGLLFLALVLPLNIPGWQFFAPRFLTTGLALALALYGGEEIERPRARIAFDVGAVALVAITLISARALHRRLANACEDALIGLDHRVARSTFQLPIIFDVNCGLSEDDTRRDVPFSKVLLHFYALFPVAHGGTVPYGFFGPAAVHAFVPRTAVVPIPPLERYWGLSRENPRLTNPRSRTQLLTELLMFGTHYENIVMFGASAADRALFLDRGYLIDFERGSFINAHYAPCGVELVAEVLPGDPPIMIRGGLGDDELWPAKVAPVAGTHAMKASLNMICGDVWVRVTWQNSEQRCANADAKGRISVHAEHGTTRVACDRSK
jgi:hypothetical protein